MPDNSVPIEEIFECTDQLHKEGKFVKLGISNFAAWDVMRINNLCNQQNLIKPSVYQGCYNALNPSIVPELLPALRSLDMSFYAYNPLAGGLLTGRYQSTEDLEKADTGRFSKEFDFVTKSNKYVALEKMKGKAGDAYRQRYGKASNFEALKQLQKTNNTIPLAESALRWLKHHSWLRASLSDGIIFGASSLSQAEANSSALNKGELPIDLVEAFNNASKNCAFDAEPYFRNYGPLPGDSSSFLQQFK